MRTAGDHLAVYWLSAMGQFRRRRGPRAAGPGPGTADPVDVITDGFAGMAPFGMERALRLMAMPTAQRWQALAGVTLPEPGWRSFDRAPWKHPWLGPTNIREFARFSGRLIETLAADTSAVPRRYAFFGNTANNGYLRSSALVPQGLDIDLIIPDSEHHAFSQPFWEDFDGTRTDLGDAFATAVMSLAGTPNVSRLPVSADWLAIHETGDARDPRLAALFPEFMPYLGQVRALDAYDAGLIAQYLQIGAMASVPYLVGQVGSEIWFDASRDDPLGWMSLAGLRKAFAVLVSNPITLAHARRHGLTNCLYVPFCIDEDRYRPGEEPGIRAEWERMSGGEFFVIMSMRLDNQWKGASTGIEGFARFAASHPGARLVVLGWGVDETGARAAMQDLGIADKVLLMPVVGKKRLARYLRSADALIEQFVLGYYGGSGLEAMASGLPVIMRLEAEQYDALVPGGVPPVLQATTADDVAAALGDLCANPNRRRDVGAALRNWFMDTHSGRATAPVYRAVLDAAARRVPIDWSGSPLSRPLGRDETAYHAQQLRDAPPFPQYDI